MNKEWEEVKLFHKKFNHPVSSCPKKMEKERAKKDITGCLKRLMNS